MNIKSLITGHGNHLISTGTRRFFYSPTERRILRESWEGEYNHLATKCEEGEVELTESFLEYLENRRTTINGLHLINSLSIGELQGLVKLFKEPSGTIILDFTIDDNSYILDKIEDLKISGFCWNTDPSDVKMHGICIIEQITASRTLSKRIGRPTGGHALTHARRK